MLCGIREYSQRFVRKDLKVSLEAVGIDTFDRNHLYFRDPWLGYK